MTCPLRDACPNGSGEFPPDDAGFGYPMGVLLLRLIDEDYVRSERAGELAERAENMKRGLGFLTSAELKARETLDDLLT